MVKIDGPRIRAIREEKGLTQLYVATAVEVTTDTVSRWENKRYPTIKKDNALRLAAALEVKLEAILDQDNAGADPPPVDDTGLREPVGSARPTAQPPPAAAAGKNSNASRLLKPVLIAGAGLLVLALLYLMVRRPDNTVETGVSVRRVAPPHFVAGQPFPVFLHIDSPVDRTISIILREKLPPGMRVAVTLPPISGQDKKDNSIRWLQKVSGATTFSYTLHSDPSFQGGIRFHGIVKVTGSDTPEIVVNGDLQAASGLHHWADTDRDNRISDEEILAVYDLVGSDTQIGIDMELIEDIWLGDGYLWLTEHQRFSVLE